MANETQHLIQLFNWIKVDPIIVESPVYSKDFQTLCAALRDDIYLFSDMTEKTS